ncbi:hypothetical protein ACFWP7_21260 [Streptomyces sp. NPDC058470]|uniref:hypothetical protein n=1 Tax=Streptomyces sp. NPDC058470 TaxID=3346515 RepID=UPI0036496AFA
MTRINRPDTLLTELRDIKRRLHALETAQRTTTTATTTAITAQAIAAEPEAAETDTTDTPEPE